MKKREEISILGYFILFFCLVLFSLTHMGDPAMEKTQNVTIRFLFVLFSFSILVTISNLIWNLLTINKKVWWRRIIQLILISEVIGLILFNLELSSNGEFLLKTFSIVAKVSYIILSVVVIGIVALVLYFVFRFLDKKMKETQLTKR